MNNRGIHPFTLIVLMLVCLGFTGFGIFLARQVMPIPGFKKPSVIVIEAFNREWACREETP